MINSRIRPPLSIASTLVAAIENPGADPLAQAIVSQLGAYAQKAAAKWTAMPIQRKQNRFFMRQPQQWLQSTNRQAGLKDRIIAFASAYTAARTQRIESRRRLLSTEYVKYLEEGPSRYVPSAVFATNRGLAADFHRYVASRLGTSGCRCEKPGDSASEPPPPTPKYGIVTQKLKCFNQCESGHDEVFLSCIAVDGNGKYIQTVSEKYSIDDDSDDVLYPHHWVYPTQATNGFLDVAIRMIEDDGGYDETSKALLAVGGVVSTIGSAVANPVVMGAGVALEIMGTLADIVGDLDDDDDYGFQTKTWGSASALQSGVGPYVLTYSGEDWAGDSFDFDLTIRLITAA